MYVKLRKKIMSYILVTTILFTTIMSIVSLIIISRSLRTNFIFSATENINQNINNSIFVIEAAKNSTIQISQNPEIIKSINSTTYNTSINPILNTLKNTSYGIIGVTLYTQNYTYSTSSIAAYPSLDEIKENTQLFNFINSTDFIFTSVRTETIANIYNNVRYNPDYGMISHIIKIPDENNDAVGYLFVDINPSYIYHHHFNYENYPNFEKTKTYIISQEGKYLKSVYNNQKDAKYISEINSNSKKISRDKKYLILNMPYISNTNVVTLVPMKPYYKNLLWIFILITLTATLLILIAYLIAKRLTNDIVNSLSRLHTKMQNTKIKTSD